ncbi:MAG: ABC transporter ATP-binding protein [Actinomycetota bacterium]
MSLLSCQGLAVAYGDIVAVHELDLEVGEGEIVALLGANGAGKTTALRAISGMLPPRKGDVLVDGRSIRGRAPEEVAVLGIAHVPEGRGIFPNLSVSDNLRMGLYGAGKHGGEADRLLRQVHELFPVLGRRGDQSAGTLSGGEQQMVAIARALVQSPRLLLLDEMSMGLAPAVVQQLFGVIEGIVAQGTAVLMVEQFVAQALRIASRAYVLEKGRVAFAGPASALAGHEEVAAAYLGGSRATGGAPRLERKGSERVMVPVDPGVLRRLEKRVEATGEPLDSVLAAALARGVAGEIGQPDGEGAVDSEGARGARGVTRGRVKR